MRIVSNLYLTWNCNFRCAHCIHECGPEVKDHMTLEQLDKAEDFIRWAKGKGHDVVVLGITGGEPTLHPHFWNVVMPRMMKLREDKIVSNFELHTNASVPVPREYFLTYNKFFNRAMVGHDPFHRRFKQLNQLYLDDYTSITNELVLRRNEWKCTDVNGNSKLLNLLRRKGRAAESLSKGILFDAPLQNRFELDCACSKYAMESPAADFTPWHINHCGEHSHPQPGETNHGQFLPYDTPNNDILISAVNYITNHSGVNCTQPCYKALTWVNGGINDLFVRVNKTEEKITA